MSCSPSKGNVARDEAGEPNKDSNKKQFNAMSLASLLRFLACFRLCLYHSTGEPVYWLKNRHTLCRRILIRGGQEGKLATQSARLIDQNVYHATHAKHFKEMDLQMCTDDLNKTNRIGDLPENHIRLMQRLHCLLVKEQSVYQTHPVQGNIDQGRVGRETGNLECKTDRLECLPCYTWKALQRDGPANVY